MNWRMGLALLCIICLAVGGWYAHHFLQVHALTVWVGTEWHIKAEGWELLIALWPAVLFLALTIGLFFTIILCALYEKAHNIDENEEIKRCKEHAENTIARYKNRVKNAIAERDLAYDNEQTAHSLARNDLAGEWEKLKATKRKIETAEKEIRIRNQQANRAMNEANTLVEQANNERDQAIMEQQRLERKSHHASHAFQRQKRKAQKLEEMLINQEPSG